MGRDALEEQLELPFEGCGKCGKNIPWDEYAINWGWCNSCFDADYEEYCKKSLDKERQD